MDKLKLKGTLSVQKIFLEYSTLIFIGLVVLYFSFFVTGFLRAPNLVNVLSQSSILAIVAAGLCFVVAIGGIDLSLTFSYDLGAMVSVMLMLSGISWVVALLVGLAVGAGLGMLNGTLVVKAKIPIFIGTLGVKYIGDSVQRLLSNGGQPIYMPRMPDAFAFLGKGSALTIINDSMRLDFRFSIILACIVLAAVSFTLNRTSFGRKLYTIGSQRDAAAYCGVPVGRYTFYAFILCGVICAFGGMVNAASYTAYLPHSGQYYLMDAIGAVFVGCTLNKKGYVNIGGTILGVLFFGMISNGLNLMGIEFAWQGVARGLLIFLIIVMNAIRRNSLLTAKKKSKVAIV